MSGSVKKVNICRNTCIISSKKRITKKFLEVSRCSQAKQRENNVEKSVLHVQSCSFFLLIYRSPCLHCLFSITQFYILFE